MGGPEALLRNKKIARRNRGGYEDENISSMHKALSILDFIISEEPVQLLGRCT